MNIIDRIFQLKNERGLTGKDIETGAGLANSSLSQWKNGKGKPSLENIIKVATYFQVSSDYLLGLSDEKSSVKDNNPITEEDELLLSAYHAASTIDKFRIIQLCMNALDNAAESGKHSNTNFVSNRSHS